MEMVKEEISPGVFGNLPSHKAIEAKIQEIMNSEEGGIAIKALSRGLSVKGLACAMGWEIEVAKALVRRLGVESQKKHAGVNK